MKYSQNGILWSNAVSIRCILSLVMFLLIYVADYSTLRRTAAVKRFSRN